MYIRTEYYMCFSRKNNHFHVHARHTLARVLYLGAYLLPGLRGRGVGGQRQGHISAIQGYAPDVHYMAVVDRGSQ